ncbi:MAG: PAS domain-containing sensor histidine kinase, partial [Alcanivoracaceae bacterium]|nr:PAS domain-containing sensor histidine kinase [Alcanivoracaceae bacterium]
MDRYSDYLSNALSISEGGIYFMIITIIMLVIIFVLYKTYKASLNVEARLQEFSSLSSSSLGRRLR